MTTEPMFHVEPSETASAAGTAPGRDLSAGRRRTQRQLALLQQGLHPLVAALRTHIPLHTEAAPVDDLQAGGRRCGNCWYRRHIHHSESGKTYPKCWYTTQSADQFETKPERMSHGTGTDVRAWWPGCRDHVYGDTRVSEDAARWVPGSDAP